ncbi:MAG: glycosyltransferase [Alkalispirochaeta sp.]
MVAKHYNWEYEGLVDPWKAHAKVTHIDPGLSFDQFSSDWFLNKRDSFQDYLLERVHAIHSSEPIDILFFYMSGRWVNRDTISALRRYGIPMVNFSFDDTRLFWGPWIDGRWTGVAPIANLFDLNLTVADPRDAQKYQKIGAKSLFLPPGGNPDVYYQDLDCVSHPRDTAVSFIGQRYGLRSSIIKHVQKRGIAITTFGVGWPAGPVSFQRKLELYRRSLITLGFGYIGSGTRTSLKGRDFEVPLTGACYVTTWNETLASLFEPDEEMVFFRDREELIAKLTWLTNHPETARRIGRSGQERALQDHTWQSRFGRIIDEVLHEDTVW